MEALFERIAEWLKELLVNSTMDRMTNLFDSVNNTVGEVAVEVGETPASFAPRIFDMIRSISESVIMPIAGIILTFVACYELVRLVTESNNLANLDIWILFKWIFKTAIAVIIVTNTFNIVMAVFELGQHVVNSSAGLIQGQTAINADILANLEEELNEMNLGALLGLFLESFLLSFTLKILSVVIFVIVYARMIEIYLMTSLAPIPMATLGSREQSMVGQNYFRSLLALAFQGFLMLICIGIYAVLIRNYSVSEHLIAHVWSVVGYTVLLAFALFKAGSLSKSIFSSH